MTQKLTQDVPVYYPLCVHSECRQAVSCLHQRAYQSLLSREQMLRVINPGHCRPDGDCPYYRDAAPVTFARGFKGMQEQMYPAQYLRFKSILTARFGVNPYYERRRGERWLTPEEQEEVHQALREVGIREPLAFDAYETAPGWYR